MKYRTLIRTFLPMVVASLASGCAALSPSESLMPAGAVPVPMTAQYQSWFRSTEACSGIRGTVENLQFYVVPGVETFATPDGQKVGEWISEGGNHRIVLAGNYQDHEMVVRHELLHALLRQAGHPDEYFVNRCQLTWDSWTQGQAD